MNDHFTELGLPRVAWIEPRDVKALHHQFMAACHPDKTQGDGGRATRLNEARRILENPATRLRHLLDLEFPDFSPKEKPQPDWDLFSRTGEAAKMAAQVSSTQATATTPLARAVAHKQSTDLRLKLETLKKELTRRALELEKKTKWLDTTDPHAVSQLAEEWTFLNRWQSTIHDAAALLTP